MNERQAKLLCAIIDQFIETAMPVGSKELLARHGSFLLSGATVRNEMRFLGEEGYLEQPHVSAGRVPTAKGYKVYVHEFMEPSKQERAVRAKFLSLKEQYFRRKDQERVEEAVMLLSHMIPNVVFATVPHKSRVSYLGLASILRQPEFQANPALAMGVVEVVEDKLSDLLEAVDIDKNIRSYIGGEHLLPQLQSCSMMVTGFSLRGEPGAIGILGPMRMDYAYNTVALEMAADLLRS
jgi:transcriptional regulator of heat shock response